MHGALGTCNVLPRAGVMGVTRRSGLRTQRRKVPLLHTSACCTYVCAHPQEESNESRVGEALVRDVSHKKIEFVVGTCSVLLLLDSSLRQCNSVADLIFLSTKT